LAIGVPFEDIGGIVDAGAVNVLYGSMMGLQTAAPADQIFHQNSPGVNNLAESGDQFGHAICTGDYNGDGFADLSIGVPFEDLAGGVDAGALNVLYGSAAGLQTAAPADQFWHQSVPGVNNLAETGDRFAFALACGDFNGDGFDDQAIGVPREDLAGGVDGGAVNVLYGSAGGLQTAAPADQFWHQDVAGVNNSVQPGDEFGFSVMGADFDGNMADDLAIGVHLEDLSGGAIIDAGAVNVIYGLPIFGLQTLGPVDEFWHQNTVGVNNVAEAGDEFGFSLTAGDFDGNLSFDLAIGVPLEDLGPGGVVVDGGAVNVLYGAGIGGLQTVGPPDQIWHQNTPFVNGLSEIGDSLGDSLIACDYNGDGFWELAIGVTQEGLAGGAGGGQINLLYGSVGSGLQTAAPADQLWHQDIAAVNNSVEPGDNFGILSSFSTVLHPLP